jgi:hypothetical protein
MAYGEVIAAVSTEMNVTNDTLSTKRNEVIMAITSEGGESGLDPSHTLPIHHHHHQLTRDHRQLSDLVPDLDMSVILLTLGHQIIARTRRKIVSVMIDEVDMEKMVIVVGVKVLVPIDSVRLNLQVWKKLVPL